MNKDTKRILLVLAFYSLASGLFYNFEELWMLDNSLSLGTISTIFSLAALLTISVLFLCSSIVRKEHLKSFTCGLILTKFICLLSLFLLNHSGQSFLIKFIILMEYTIDVEIYASIYPMLSQINKSDKVFAIRGILYDALYYFGVLFSFIFMGKSIGFLKFSYNTNVFLAAISMFISYLILRRIDLNKYEDKKKSKKPVSKLLPRIINDKVSIYYLLFVCIGNISYYSLNGTFMILLTKGLTLTSGKATLLVLILGIASVCLGALVLSKLTFKNNYINISIKYAGRMFLYMIAFMFNSKILFLLSIIFTRVTVDSYTHVSDGPYANRLSEDDQFSFSNLKDGAGFLGRAIGTLICGVLLVINIRLNYLSAFVFAFIQVAFAFYALHLYNLEKEKK